MNTFDNEEHQNNIPETLQQTNDSETLQQNHDECLLCPICRDLLIVPRLYKCGHNVCEECMVNADKTTEEDYTHTAPVYKCPICRDETIQKWYDRPINNALIDVLCKLSIEYKLRNNQHIRKKVADIPESCVPNNVNLAYISKNIREIRSENIYKQILPILYRAALDGKAYVNITTSDISGVSDLVAKKLIERNGIYRFTSNLRECQIELVQTGHLYQRYDFENENYNTTDPIIYTPQEDNLLNNNSNSSDSNNQDHQDHQDNQDNQDHQDHSQTQITYDNNTTAIRIQDSLQSLSSTTPTDIVAVTIHDSDGTPVSGTQSRELSSFLVNHILRNLGNRH